MKGWVLGPAGGSVHMVCPRLLEKDPRHGRHLIGPAEQARHTRERHDREGGPSCDCLRDDWGHRVATVMFPEAVSEIPDADLACPCGAQLVVGERLG